MNQTTKSRLQFEDLYLLTTDVLDLGCSAKEIQEMERRLTHTFFEWDEIFYSNEWTVTFHVSVSGKIKSGGMTICKDSIEEVKKAIIHKLAFDERLGRKFYALIENEFFDIPDEFIYNLIDNHTNKNCGAVIIEKMSK